MAQRLTRRSVGTSALQEETHSWIMAQGYWYRGAGVQESRRRGPGGYRDAGVLVSVSSGSGIVEQRFGSVS